VACVQQRGRNTTVKHPEDGSAARDHATSADPPVHPAAMDGLEEASDGINAPPALESALSKARKHTHTLVPSLNLANALNMPMKPPRHPAGSDHDLHGNASGDCAISGDEGSNSDESLGIDT